MCDDGITNGGPITFNSTGGGGGGGSGLPANVIIASNVLNTNGNVLCANIISGDGTFSGNLYVAGNIFGNVSSFNVYGIINALSFQGGTFLGNGSGLSNLNASNLSGSANLTSLNTTSLSFQNAILPTNLPLLTTAQGTWGSSANVAQVTIDQYGRVSAAANIAITSSQWTSIDANVAYGNGVSIGTISDPPPGSNLYVLGTANITTLNVTTLFANTATIFGPATLNVLGTSNLNTVLGQAYFGNGAGLSNLNASNLAFGVINSALIYGNTLSNLNSSNLVGNVANATVSLVVSQASQPNITSVGTLTGLNVQGLLIASNGSGISNINWSNIIQPFGNLVVSNSVTTTNVVATLANITSLNVTSIETATQLNAGNVTVSNSITVSNLSVSGNIIPVTQGNTYVQGNVVVSGNVYTSLGELGVGGSLFFSLGAPYTPSTFTGSIPGAGALTNKIQMSVFTQKGSSTYVSVSANGCFQFSQTGVYTVASNFLTNYNNVLGIGIGSNVIDYGTRTDQTYLYSIIPFISQNPTAILEAQFYVSNTANYYYIDTFSVDGVTFQPTSNVNGGTWISIAPLGGVAAASQTITLSTLGNTVTSQGTNYGAQITDYYIGCSAGITVTLPLGATLTAGKQYVIKDEAGTASASHITITPYSGNLIDGSSSVILSINYGALTLYWTGAKWSIV